MSCCVQEIELCMAQGADRRFFFHAVDRDRNPVDLDDFDELTFKVVTRLNGPVLLTKSFSGGGIVKAAGGVFYADVDHDESAALPVGRLHCQVWGVTAAGDEDALGAGPFVVQDTI